MNKWFKICMLVVLIIGTVSMSGCTSQTPVVTTTPAPTQIPTTVLTITPQKTVISTPSQTYKTADVVLIQTKPSIRFKMDFPSDWTNESVETVWGASYLFKTPDWKTGVYVLLDNHAGSGDYLYPLDTPTQNSEGVWSEGIIKEMKNAYCHDNAGNVIECSSTSSSRDYYYFNLVTNDAVVLSGNVKARKLVFAPDERDTSGYWYMWYLMHVGKMQGYNFTVPGHPEVAVKVDGPVWDYGMGGQALAIFISIPDKEMKATSDILEHMVKSFEIIS